MLIPANVTQPKLFNTIPIILSGTHLLTKGEFYKTVSKLKPVLHAENGFSKIVRLHAQSKK